MQVAERRNFMDIFYINCFSHSLYLSRASNISCFSCFLTIIYAINMPKLNASGGKGKIHVTHKSTVARTVMCNMVSEVG